MAKTGQAYDIAIVGGGMVGLTLALLLARQRRDWRVAIIESHPLIPPSQTPPPESFDARSTALAQGSRKILEQCGVWPLLAGQLTAITDVHVSDRGHFAGNLLRAKDLGYEALGYVVENPRLGRALLQCFENSPNLYPQAPAKVSGLERRREGWRVALEQDSLSCGLLILADGANSRLGQRLGIRYRVEDYGQQALIANVECDQPHGGVAYERFTDCGPVALLPLGGSPHGRQSALVWTRPLSRVEELMDLSDSEFCRQLQADFGYRAGRFCRVGKRQAYPLQLALATEQIRAGLVLMGNAAHFLHPVAGQGFNLALRDCQTLDDVLAGADNPGALPVLETYLARQQSDQITTVGFSHSLVKLFSTGALPSALLRSLGLLGLDSIEPAKRLFAKQAMGMPLAGSAR